MAWCGTGRGGHLLGWLMVAVLAVALSSRPGRADDLGFPISVGAWTGNAYGDSGGFSHCSVYATYNSDITLFLGMDAGSFFIGLLKDGWSLGEGTSYPLTLTVDQIATRSVTAQGDRDILWIEFGADVAFLRAVQQGRILFVDAAREDFEFELKGTYAALNRVASCVVAFTGESLIGDPALAKKEKEPEDGNPFGSGEEATPKVSGGSAAGGSTSGNSGFFDAREVLEVLEEAEFPRAQLLPETELPLFEGNAPFMVWLSEDEELPIVGFLLFVEHTDQPREALQSLQQLVVEACPYAVAAGLDTLVERAGVRVAGGRVLCEGEDSVEVTYFAATPKRGGVYVFAHTGDKSTQLMTRDINQKLKDVLLGYSF